MVLSYHAMLIDSFQTLWGAGSNTYGQIGSETGSENFLKTPIKVLENCISVSSGLFHTAVITIDNRLMTFGLNDKGQLGIGHQTNTAIPTEVKFNEDVNIVAVECGLFHTSALDSDGNLWVFGDNSAEQCGLPNYSMFTHQDSIIITPRKIKADDVFDSTKNIPVDLTLKGNDGIKIGSDIYDISCGNMTTSYRKNNQALIMGSNSSNQMTLEVPNRTCEFVRLNDFLPNIDDPTSKDHDIINIFCGTEFTILHTKSNDVYVAGKITAFEDGQYVSKNHKRFFRIANNVEEMKYTNRSISLVKKTPLSLNQEILEIPVVFSTDTIYDRNYYMPPHDMIIYFAGEIHDFSPGIKYDIFANGWKFKGLDKSYYTVEDLLYNKVGRV